MHFSVPPNRSVSATGTTAASRSMPAFGETSDKGWFYGKHVSLRRPPNAPNPLMRFVRVEQERLVTQRR
jgi:hypothetical protein